MWRQRKDAIFPGKSKNLLKDKRRYVVSRCKNRAIGVGNPDIRDSTAIQYVGIRRLLKHGRQSLRKYGSKSSHNYEIGQTGIT